MIGHKSTSIFIFLIVILATTFYEENYHLDPINSNHEYLYVHKQEALLSNSQNYEGLKITVWMRVQSINETKSIVVSEENVNYYFKQIPLNLEFNLALTIRGISHLIENGTVTVLDFHTSQSGKLILLSLPGILIFVLLLFRYYKLELKRFEFQRRE